MKIVHVGIHYNPNRGGGNLRNSRILDEFVRTFPNNKITLISYKYANTEFEAKSGDNLNIFFTNSVFKQIILVLKIYFTTGVDVIHCHNPRLFFFVSLLPLKLKIILELHSFQSMSKIKERLFSMFLKRANRIIVLGKFGVQLLIEKFGIKKDNIDVISNGYIKKCIKLTDHSTNEYKKNIVYIGSFYEWQGIYNFINAIKIYIEKYGPDNANFYLVGGGIEFDGAKSLIKSLNLSSYISLTGQISPHEIDEYWSMADVFVVPRPSTQATETTVPLKLFDAFAFGKVIIGSNVKGVTEMVEDNYNGLIYNHEDLNEFAKCMNRVVVDGELFNKLSVNSIQFCEKLPTWSDIAAQLNQVYQKALK